MKANCNDWLTFRDERHTLAYESSRRVTTTNEPQRIITHLKLLSRFECLIMFSIVSFHINTDQATHQVHYVFSRQNEAAVCGFHGTPRSLSATNCHHHTNVFNSPGCVTCIRLCVRGGGGVKAML